MEDDTAARVYADPLARWFVTEAYRITDTGQLIAQAGEQLVRAGIPLYRMAYFQGTLHPEFAGNGYFWRRDQGVVVQSAQHGLFQRDVFLDNPLPPVIEQRKTVVSAWSGSSRRRRSCASSRTRVPPTMSPCR